ncbi:MAG: hypothetical protein ABSA47_09095 [Verrucomicrobiota bacterium]
MNILKRRLILAGCVVALGFGTASVMAQGGGGGGFGRGGGGGAPAAPPDPTPVYQKILESERRALAVTNNDEWDVISPRLLKVVQMKMEAHTLQVRSLFGVIFRATNATNAGFGRGRGRGRTPPPSVENQMLTGVVPDASNPAADILLQKAQADQSTTADITAALTKARAARKQKLADMAKAESDLREVLTHEQEAALVARGILELDTDSGPAQPSGGILTDLSPAIQKILDADRVTLSVTGDDEWGVIAPRLRRVVQFQLDAYAVGVNSLFLLNGVRVITQLPAGRPDIGQELGSKVITGELSVALDPAEHGLQNATETKAPMTEVNAALANARATREARLAGLAQAQADLLELLTHRQEAVLVATGLLE